MPTIVWVWVVRLGALVVAGPIAGALTESMRGVDGSSHATLLLSGSPLRGVGVLVLVFALAMLAGVGGARLVHRREGALDAGLVFGWAAWGMAGLDEAIRVDPGAGALSMLALEGVLVALAGLVVLGVVTRFGAPDETRGDTVRLDRAALASALGAAPVMLGALGAALVAAMVVAWAQTPSGLSGQSVWGGFVGGFVGGLAGAFVVQSGKIGDAPSALPMIVGVLLCAVAAPLVAVVTPGAGGLLGAIADSSVPGFVLVSPLAWACGALVGVPVGAGWVESSVAKQAARDAAA